MKTLNARQHRKELSKVAEGRALHGKAIQQFLMENIKTHKMYMHSIIIQAGLDPRSNIAVGKRKPSPATLRKDLARFADDLLCYLATGEILNRAWGKGELDVTSARLAMETVPRNIYPHKLVKVAWDICSTSPMYAKSDEVKHLAKEGGTTLSEQAANLLYRKARLSCRGKLGSNTRWNPNLKPEVNDYLNLIDYVKYDGK
jgi:hypothetical protein